MKNMLRDAGILFVITVAAGLILGFVYQITKEPIATQQEATASAAYAEVFAQADHFEEVTEAPAIVESEWKTMGYGQVSVGAVLCALDASGNQLGYVINVTSHDGYGGDISIAVGISNDGLVNGISILDISETAGLGMRAEEVLKPQFASKNVTNFSYTKTGATMDSQIDAISGATITTNAVTTAVNGGLYYFQTALGGGSGNE